MTIRQAAGAEDFELLHALLLEYENDLPPVLRHGLVPPVEDLKRKELPGEASFLASVSETAAGCVAVRRQDAQTAVLMRLYVRPEARGLGAGRALAEAAVEFARAGGYGRIALDTDKDQLPAAYALYRSMGFRECAAFGPVDYPCATFMERPL